MKLVMPLPLARGNARLHWRTENRRKHEYWDLCLATVKTKRPSVPLRRALITITLYCWNTMDEPGLWERLKWPVDWLVRRGYIEDDSPRVLTYGPVRQAIDRRSLRIEIELEAIEESGDAA